MVANPATIPVAIPTTPVLPVCRRSTRHQTIAAVAAERWVTNIVMPAASLAPPCEPALKPNQPTHSKDAPIITKPGLCGGLNWEGNPFRGPIILAKTRAETPAVA